MCFGYSLSYTVIAVLLLAAAGILAAPPVVVVEKAGDPAPVSPQPERNIAEVCHQPMEMGRCFALFYRFGYNVDNNACEEFIYGGCAGNTNNFETLEQCQSACLGKGTLSTEVPTELSTEQAPEQSTEEIPEATISP
ncbi:hypothetical protein KR018_004361 [Drosophila ironensis]|nr:hypothetical protein KR018_004361 [Drosophila ironensis]